MQSVEELLKLRLAQLDHATTIELRERIREKFFLN